jgi:hypothetical protein
MMQALFGHGLLAEDGAGVFALVSIALGGGAAFLAGRAVALTWRPWWHVAFFMLILGGAVRFIHFALFEATLLSLHYYAVDALVCLVFGLIGFRATRAVQMTRQYPWLYASNGPLRWRRKLS